jgi:hypothetical protein
MALTGWPSITDDDGTYTVGTIFNKAFFDSIEAALEAYLVSGTNPTVTPADAIDELVDARGSKASLDARLDVSMNDDGTLKSLAGYATSAQLQSQISQNLFADSLLLLWPDGDAAAPYNWTTAGAGVAIARCGSGLADTQQMPYGDFCARLTYGTAAATATKQIIGAAAIGKLGGLKGRTVGVGVYCKCSIASAASLIVDDGVTTTRGGESGNGTYHSGDGGANWIYATHTLDSAATKLDIAIEMNQNGAIYFGNFVLIISEVAPSDWHPEHFGWFVAGQQQRGDITVTADLNELSLPFPIPHGALLYETKLKMRTAPVGSDAIYDVNKNGATAYTTKPTVADGATYGDARPDGTYANRCFKHEDLLSWDCDQIGSGTAGANTTAEFIFFVPLSRLDIGAI